MQIMHSIEYQMLHDMDEYILPDNSIEYSYSNEYIELFNQESHNYDDIQHFHKTGRKLTKVDLLPEQCRSTNKVYFKIFYCI